MTQLPIDQHILQPRLIVPSLDFDPRDGDLVLAIDDSDVNIHPLLAACSKNGRAHPHAHTVHLLLRTESPIVFHASRVVLIAPPITFGAGVLPHICLFARTPNGIVQYNTDRYFVGRDNVFGAIKTETRLQDYIPWFEAYFP